MLLRRSTIGATPDQFATALAADITKHAKVMKVSGVQPE